MCLGLFVSYSAQTHCQPLPFPLLVCFYITHILHVRALWHTYKYGQLWMFLIAFDIGTRTFVAGFIFILILQLRGWNGPCAAWIWWSVRDGRHWGMSTTLLIKCNNSSLPVCSQLIHMCCRLCSKPSQQLAQCPTLVFLYSLWSNELYFWGQLFSVLSEHRSLRNHSKASIFNRSGCRYGAVPSSKF